jgi:predicted PolB exonuclease-like 3'-5' exonuclease
MLRTYLVVDAKTVLDTSLPYPTTTDRLPAAPYHRIVSLGVCWFDANHTVIRFGIVGEGKEEKDMLVDFVDFFRRKIVIVSWNGRSFEMSVIAARCFKYGIPFAPYYQERGIGRSRTMSWRSFAPYYEKRGLHYYYYGNEGHLDLMDFLSDFGASHPARLDTASRLIGLPGKMGVEGKDVGPLVHAGKLAEVQSYCLSDVIQIAALFLRTQLARGILNLDSYRHAMEKLLRQADKDKRIAHVLAAIDRATLLLASKTPLP